jgi:SWIM zinc finger
MSQALTREQVLALAPDSASAKAATGLLADSKWVTLGTDAEAVWGECQGSGAKPYQAQVELATLASRCSCPSRKFPCKHGLALLLLYAQRNPRFAAAAARPAWVDEWLASRRGRAEKKEKAAESAAAKAVADPAATDAAAAKREGARWKRIESGTAELQRWIADQFRGGLARFGPEQRRDWAAMAARMIDAQAPGLAPRVQEALDFMAAGVAHYGKVVEIFGLLQLINEGVRRRAQLSPARLADLRAALGWPPDKDEVMAMGEAVTDQWRVLGQVIAEPDAKLSERRVWLQGVASGRHALLQEFAYGGRGWERAWRHAAHYQATLKFFPGSVPLRALAVDVAAESAPQAWRAGAAEAAFDALSQAYAGNPWLAQAPLVFDAATPFRDGAGWRLHTAAGTAGLQIADAAAWSLLAFSGGHAVGVMGEWDGSRLQLLSAWDAQGAQWTPEVAA